VIREWSPCLFCSGDRSDPDHDLHCDGRQGTIEETLARGPVLHPPHNGTDTSIAAAYSVEGPVVETLRRRVLITIEQRASTCDELEAALGLSHQTVSARVWELRRLGLVADEGLRRQTRSGRAAKVWARVWGGV